MIDEFVKGSFTTNTPFFARIVTLSKKHEDVDSYTWMSEMEIRPPDAVVLKHVFDVFCLFCENGSVELFNCVRIC